MNVILEEGGQPVNGNLILKCVIRSALAPIPRTLEVTFRYTAELAGKIAEGAKVWAGRDSAKYHIVKVESPRPAALMQSGEQMAMIRITALLDACHKVAFRLARAVVKDKSTFGEVYRACGADAAIANDFSVRRFACFKGMVPTFHLAQALQEEAGLLVYRDEKFSFVRLDDLVKQEPVMALAGDVGESIASEFKERHEIPTFISTDESGAFLRGNEVKDRAVLYSPRTGMRELFNLSKVMVERRTLESMLAQHVMAGDVLKLGEEVMTVTTAVHVFEQDAENQGQIGTYSKFWLGTVAQ